MITHDVDEAIYLADKIILMTNGPEAMVAEIVENPLPKDRDRNQIHKHPSFYAIRNHLIDSSSRGPRPSRTRSPPITTGASRPSCAPPANRSPCRRRKPTGARSPDFPETFKKEPTP